LNLDFNGAKDRKFNQTRSLILESAAEPVAPKLKIGFYFIHDPKGLI
jgi:hypothetical protein